MEWIQQQDPIFLGFVIVMFGLFSALFLLSIKQEDK